MGSEDGKQAVLQIDGCQCSLSNNILIGLFTVIPISLSDNFNFTDNYHLRLY